MDEQIIEVSRDTLSRGLTVRDIARVCFRRQHLIVGSFLGILLCLMFVVLISRDTFEAEVEILVKGERAYPVVAAGNNNTTSASAPTIAEEDINSEVELLKSQDLLEKVVITCGLDREMNKSKLWHLNPIFGPFSKLFSKSQNLAIPVSVRHLQKHLKVEPIAKTTVIRITYASADPQLAANVLKTLTALYLEKHMEVRRPSGSFAFFEQETSRYWQQLQVAQRRVAEYDRVQGTVSAQTEKAAKEQKLADFDGALRQMRTTIEATKTRILTLKQQTSSTANRLTTEIHTTAVFLQQLKSTLLTLELKRSDLAGKYASNYRPLMEVQAEIAHTKATIAEEQAAPSHEDTTDRNPTFQWMSDELAKAEVDLASQQAQARAIETQINAYRNELLELDKKDFEQQDLIRAAKTEESNYLLYLNKREEARISDALDQKHILNVALAEAATVPALPVRPNRSAMLLASFAIAGFVSIGLAFGKDYLDGLLHSPDDVRVVLGIPVLASFPTYSLEATNDIPALNEIVEVDGTTDSGSVED